ncbi:MAG: hypothetical protein F6K21_37715 [Symploca sp. SIO2D2]|nr:hypothetical protein [Symploca sp. SIO2D2]NER23296.1 hypothetical protein [Symploca sp. SIO1C2]
MKRLFPIWQITLPLCGVLIFAIGALTTVYMVNGRYLFDLEASPKGIKIKTDVDKRSSDSAKDSNQQKTAEK